MGRGGCGNAGPMRVRKGWGGGRVRRGGPAAQAGSCIDGRLTSAWHWCSKIEKKDYYPIFKLAGAPHQPPIAGKVVQGGARAACHSDKSGMDGMHQQKVEGRS